MKIVRFDLEAVEEMKEAAAWYEARSPGLGGRFLDEIERLEMTIAERPASYTPSRCHLLTWSFVGRSAPTSRTA